MRNLKAAHAVWLAQAVLLLATFLIYFHTRQFDFVVWDDDRMLYANPHVQGLSLQQMEWMFADSTYNRLYMPLGWMFYAISVVCVGLDPHLQHWVNIGFHAANAFLVFALLRSLLRFLVPRDDAGAQRKIIFPAWIGALFWAAHPLRVEVVALIAGRVHSQASVWVFAAAWCYLEARWRRPAANGLMRSPFFWASVCFYGISLLTFPIGLMLPVVLLILDVYVLPGKLPKPSWKAIRLLALEKIPFAVVAAIPLGASLWGRAHFNLEPAPTLAQFSLFSRVMQAGYVWVHYLQVLLFPVDLSPVYARLSRFDPLEPAFVISAAIVLGGSVAGFVFRRKHPRLWGAWLCHLVILVPFLGLTEHPHIPSDRYAYVTGVVWSAVLAGGLLGLREKQASRKVRRVAQGAALALIGIFGLLSARQANIWRNTDTLYQYILSQLGDDPYRADIYGRQALYSKNAGHPAAALAQIDEALAVLPDHPQSLFTKGEILLDLAQAAAAQHQPQAAIDQLYLDAAAQFDRTYAISAYFDSLTLSGWAYGKARQWPEALPRLARATELAPTVGKIRVSYAKVLYLSGQTGLALTELDHAIQDDPALAAQKAAILQAWVNDAIVPDPSPSLANKPTDEPPATSGTPAVPPN